MSKARWQDALPALRKLGYEYLRTENHLGHRCQVFNLENRQRTLLVRSRCYDCRGIYWTHAPSNLDVRSTTWPTEIAYFCGGERLYIVPTTEFIRHLHDHRSSLNVEREMYIFNIVIARDQIRETDFSLRPYRKELVPKWSDLITVGDRHVSPFDGASYHSVSPPLRSQ